MNFIRATLEDAQFLFDLRNDALTRAQSHDVSEIVFQDHLNWLAKTLERTDREIYIVKLNESRIGTIRRDLMNQSWLLSWTISPDSRGKGYGAKMLSEFVKQFRAAYLAEIKNENIASIKMAEVAGFVLKEKCDGFLRYSL